MIIGCSNEWKKCNVRLPVSGVFHKKFATVTCVV
uniref:Uncharacterized protein n=1 Tax=Arundo donax TaxID=35708 RepID=A0A0A9C188_ARUDO